MEATGSIAGLKQYLDIFKREISKIDIRRLEEIPKFYIPNWPDRVAIDRIRFRLRKKILVVVIGRATGLPTLKTRVMPKIGFTIDTEGSIFIEIYNFRDCWHDSGWSIDFKSTSDNKDFRLACFVLFSQCLDEICGKVIKALSKKLARTKAEKENYEKLVAAVKRSFEPLIPFVVADILSDGRQ